MVDSSSESPVLMAREAWVYRVLSRATALPIVAAGELPDGGGWGLALGVGRHGVEGHVALRWSTGGWIVAGLGTRGNQESRRFFVWAASRTIEQIELSTGESDAGAGDAVDAVVLHDDQDRDLRVFLAVIDDRGLVLRGARHLDQHAQVLMLEDLTEYQERFEASMRWMNDVRRYGLDPVTRQPAYPPLAP